MNNDRLDYIIAKKQAGQAGGVAVARRYSGDVSVTIIYRDNQSDYACKVRSKCSRSPTYVFIGRAPAVDSRVAFDEVARAAIAFAEDDNFYCNPEYDKELTQVEVRGTKQRRRQRAA
jgi:hypothetical protein